MKTTLIPAVAGLALMAGIGIAAADEVIVTPEQQTVVKEYVHKHPIASVNVLGLELGIGSTVPDTVELQEVPDVQYRYVVVNDHTVLVDPSTRRVVQFIQLIWPWGARSPYRRIGLFSPPGITLKMVSGLGGNEARSRCHASSTC
jgi:hypothetical protein